MKRFYSLLILTCAFLSTVYGQEQEQEPRSGAGRFFFGKRGNSYTYIGLGFGNYALKDQNQSLLTYRTTIDLQAPGGFSVPTYFTLGHVKRREGRERTIIINLMSQNALANDFDIKRFMVLGTSMFLSYNALYTLNPLSSERFNFKVGGDLNLYASIVRVDPGLQNNAVVATEVFAALNPVVKLSYDLSRKEAKESKFLFFKPKLRPQRERNVSFMLKIPGMSINNRPNNYAFKTQNTELSSESTANNRDLEFGGMILGTETYLEWKLLNNENRMRIGFTWDFIAQEKFNREFYSSRLLIGVAFLFNTRTINKEQ